jgi:tRNA-specific 2-thiouridylase
MAKRVVLAMSGGVDSSVAASLLKGRGYEVIGVFMRTGAYAEGSQGRSKTCCSATDAADAQNVADRLDIPFFALDFEREFVRIMDAFTDEYASGRTPNPCVMCNIWLKFGKLWSHGKRLGADFVATGHYARTALAADGTCRVARAVDRSKDQSYVLSGLAPALLPHILFPIGDHTKADVREIAKLLGLPVHDKPDSQEICFVPGDDYVKFIKERRPGLDSSGPILDEDGSILAQHSGIEGFTIGQRRGLGVAVGTPRYVVQIEPQTKTVTLGRREALAKRGLTAERFNWQGRIPDSPIECLAQVRTRHQPVRAVARPIDGGRVTVEFEVPVEAVTPGQVITLYQDDLVLGGGWIERAID